MIMSSGQTAAPWLMVVSPNRFLEPKLFSSWGRDPSSSSHVEQVAGGLETETARPSRYILPKDLDAAIRQLEDQELDRLVSAAPIHRSRPPSHQLNRILHRRI